MAKQTKKQPVAKNEDAVASGKRLRVARVGFYPDRKMSLRELSQRTGGLLSDSRISNYEQGNRLVKPREALILGRALGVSAAHLLCVAQEDELTKSELQLLRNWRALPEKLRNHYLREICAKAIEHLEPAKQEKVEAAYGRPKHKA